MKQRLSLSTLMIWAALGLFLALFWPSLGLGYLADDFDLLIAVAESPHPWPLIWNAFPAGSGSYFRPLVMLSLWPVHHFLGAAAAPVHHGVNMAMHLSVICLVYRLGTLLGARRHSAIAASALFGFHQANLTDVLWISGRTDLLCTVFYLTGIYGLGRYWHHRHWFWFTLTAAGCSGALASKEMAVSFPAAALLTVFWLAPRTHWPQALRAMKAPLLTVGFLVSAYLLRYAFAATGSPGLASPQQMASNLIKNGFFFVSPLPLHLLKWHPIWWVLFILITGTAAFALIIIWHRTKCRWRGSLVKAGLAGAAVLGAMAPVLVFLNGAHGRLLYLPLALFLAFWSAFWATTSSNCKPVAIWTSALAAVMALGASYQIQNWRTAGQWAADCGQSFQDQTAHLPGFTQIYVMTSPSQYRDAPVFGNDLEEALHFYRTGNLGYPQQIFGVGRLAIFGSKPLPEFGGLPTQEEGLFIRQLPTDSQHYFDFGPNIKSGHSWRFGGGETRILKVQPPSRVYAFSFLPQPRNQSWLIFDLNGMSFTQTLANK